MKWLTPLLGVTVIKDHQSAKRPSLPYAVLDLANFRDLYQQPRDILYGQLTTLNTEGEPEVEAVPDLEVEWVFMLMTYGPGCADRLRRLQSAVHLTQINEPLLPHLVVHEVGSVNTVPELIGERWEDRAQVNITVRGTTSDGFKVDVINEPNIIITGERA